MAQMAPALTEARASPSSSEKHFAEPSSVNLEGQSKQEDISKNLQNNKLSQNGFHKSLVNICNNRTSCDSNTPKASSLSQQQEGRHLLNGIPNGESSIFKGESIEKMVNGTTSAPKCEIQNNTLPRCTTTCASAVSRPAGTCETGCTKDTDIRLFQPVADLESKETSLVKKKNVISKQQTKLEKRAKKLQRRLYKLEARQLDLHVRQQLGGFIDQKKQNSELLTEYNIEKETNKEIKIGISKSLSKHGLKLSDNQYRNENEIKLESDHVAKPASTDSLVPLRASKGSYNFSKNTDEACPLDDSMTNSCIRNENVDNFGKQAQEVVGNLITQLELFETVGDSDATDSSSGGESCDEEDNQPEQRTTSSSGASSVFEQDRTGVAAKWSWLQAQVIDIDRRIKRYDTLHRNLRLTKGTVKLDGICSDVHPIKSVDGVGVPSLDKGGVDMTSLGQKLGELYNKSGHNHWCNGVRKPLTEGSTLNIEQESIVKRQRIGVDASESGNSCFDCARTRPIKHVKRRRLVQLSKLNLLNKKPLTVGCSCSSIWTPCILCPKTVHTVPVIDPNQLLQERVALLDHSYHSVLSSSSDIPLQLHFESLLRRGGFESRTKPLSPSKPTVQNKRRNQTHNNNNIKKIKVSKVAAASLLSSAKLRKSEKNNQSRNNPSSLPSTPKNNVKVDRLCRTEPRQKRAAAITAAAQLQKRARSLSLPTTSPPSAPTTPPPPENTESKLSQSMPPSSLSSLLRKKRPSTAFDINNIVIPYSMASTTRVEKLQYKEIITPQWRVNELEPIHEASTDTHDPNLKEVMTQELEDLSEELFSSRHAICEMKEKQRFLGLLTKKRKRSNRGTGSELTTPEPLSPAALDSSTPPGTPAPVLTTSCSISTLTTPLASTSTPSPLIERQPSGHTRSASTDSQYEDMFLVVPPWPQRVFPLNDEELESLKESHETPIPSCPPSPNPSAISSPISWQSSPANSPLASPDCTKGESWTVKVVTPEESDPDKPRKGIVLKLAKR